jgi:hypothetical protein
MEPRGALEVGPAGRGPADEPLRCPDGRRGTGGREAVEEADGSELSAGAPGLVLRSVVWIVRIRMRITAPRLECRDAVRT